MSTKTPGQIAYEAHEASYRKISTPWDKLDKWQRLPWDAVAKAVLATVPQPGIGSSGVTTVVASPHGGTAFGWSGASSSHAFSGGCAGGVVAQRLTREGGEGGTC